MNINEAKDYIKHSIQVYLKKDEFGDYKIPVVRQRPIFLLGAPGIGKTAIMEQIAQEMGIALVSYSMTHHTRQSALGLPFIKQKEYGGKTYDVSEYTMSEIIASVYETMEESGVKEGVLFLDEINCVSETLAPSMLQFLQYKVFGKHKVPEGWVIVTAGNPPEYNKSVREYVTARGWEDLSQVMLLYEEDGLKVDETLFGQYLQNETIVKEFGAYYDLYNKYKKDYEVEELLAGNISEGMISKAKNASFDERLSLLGMLIDKLQNEMKDVMETSAYLTELMPPLKAVKTADSAYKMIETQEKAREKLLHNLASANSLSSEDKRKHKRIKLFLNTVKKELLESGILMDDNDSVFTFVKERFDGQVADMKTAVAHTGDRLHYLFEFANQAFSQGNEMLVLVTELTVNKYSARYISMYGCEDYQKYNGLLMVSERSQDLKEEIKDLML